MYADGICLIAQSHAALQKLINICCDFSVQNNLSLSFPSHFMWCLILDCINYRVLGLHEHQEA